MRRFRAEHAPSLRFAADPSGVLLERYGVKAPVLTLALRTTFVINEAGRVVAVFSGSDAIEARRTLDALWTSPAPPATRPAASSP